MLDGVRGLAIAMVLVFHFVGNTLATNRFERIVVNIANYGSYGVDLFFILSGFLITGVLYEGWSKPYYFRNFFMRRALRIFPLYYGVLALLFFVAPRIPVLRGETLSFLAERQAWAWLYGVNIYIARADGWSFSYLDHFWSLAVEEHFYLVWPLIVFLLARRPRSLLIACLAISLGAMLARLLWSLLGFDWWPAYVLTPFRLDGLALGAFLAVAVRQPHGRTWIGRALPAVAATPAAILLATFIWAALMPQHGLALLLPLRAIAFEVLLACLLMAAFLAPAASLLARVLGSRVLVLLGTYSYGLYVYHHFISYYLTTNRLELQLGERLGSHAAAVALQAVVGVALSLAVAYLSYEHYEKRFLALKPRFALPAPAIDRPVSAASAAGS